MSQQTIDLLIASLIIDNDIMAINPAKMRQVLYAINHSIGVVNAAEVTATEPLNYDAFTNTFSLPPIAYGQRRLKAQGATSGPGWQIGHIVEGWSPDGKSWWDSAVYNGGDQDDANNYTVIVGSQIIA